MFMIGEGCLWLFTAERENFGVQIWTDLRGESEKKKKKTKQNKTKIFGRSQNKPGGFGH